MAANVQVKILLREYLDELNDDALREFQWFLSITDREGYQTIPRSQLEEATRTETVDKLVQFYGEDGAVETTVDTFFKMRLNDLAVKLIRANDGDEEQESYESYVSYDPVPPPAEETQSDVNLTGPEDLSCSVCLFVFTEPVMLQCGHSFCRSCVHNDWRVGCIRKCPICRKIHPNTEPPINYNLKSLSENYKREKRS